MITMKQLSKLLTLILFSFIFSNLSAQEDKFKNDPVATKEDDRTFRLGLQFSPNLSWLSPSTSGFEGEGTRFNFNYGLSTEFFLTKNYLFSTGLFVSSLGGEVSYEGLYKDGSGNYFPSKVKQSYNIQYLEIPVVLKLRTNQLGYMTYYGAFGLRTAFKLNSNSDYEYAAGYPKLENENTGSDVFFMNMWLVIGGGIEYNLSGNTNISVGVTYNNGFINVLNSKPNELDANGNASLDTDGKPVYKDKDASANINYFALEIGLYF